MRQGLLVVLRRQLFIELVKTKHIVVTTTTTTTITYSSSK